MAVTVNEITNAAKVTMSPDSLLMQVGRATYTGTDTTGTFNCQMRNLVSAQVGPKASSALAAAEAHTAKMASAGVVTLTRTGASITNGGEVFFVLYGY